VTEDLDFLFNIIYLFNLLKYFYSHFEILFLELCFIFDGFTLNLKLNNSLLPVTTLFKGTST